MNIEDDNAPGRISREFTNLDNIPSSVTTREPTQAPLSARSTEPLLAGHRPATASRSLLSERTLSLHTLPPADDVTEDENGNELKENGGPVVSPGIPQPKRAYEDEFKDPWYSYNRLCCCFMRNKVQEVKPAQQTTSCSVQNLQPT